MYIEIFRARGDMSFLNYCSTIKSGSMKHNQGDEYILAMTSLQRRGHTRIDFTSSTME